jgi:hypothetical protein
MLSEPAKVTVTVAKAIRRGAGKRGKTSYRTIAEISQSAGEGPQTVALATRLGSRKLTPGAYRLTLVATADGLTATASPVSYFKISGR